MKKVAQRDRCYVCALKTVHGERIHLGANTPLNEFASPPRCIFSDLMSLAMGYLRAPDVLEELAEAQVVPSHLVGRPMDEIVMWLVADSSNSGPGLPGVADVMCERFQIDISGQEGDF